MSAELVEYWLKSGRNAVINQLSLKPVEHAFMEGKPLSSQKGQAEAFFLVDDNGRWWILKKFHNTSNLNRSYLNRISSLVPKEDGFLCGTKRQVLSQGTLHKIVGYHYNRNLDQWLDGTILMPRIEGIDWATLADEIRNGKIKPTQLQRFSLCKNLTRLIELLESGKCCHRDLSCGNVFIDTNTWQVYLIDFDSFYHPSLAIPRGTTCGTTGYMPHQAWNNGKPDARKTWCENTDRYALTLLNIEFLLMDQGTAITGEGGIFDQDELSRQSGSRINSVISQLKTQYPLAAQFLESTIHSCNFSDCPSPQDWCSFCNTKGRGIFAPPSLDDFQKIQPGYAANILNKCRQAPIWPAPSLKDMSDSTMEIPGYSESQDLSTKPPDQWLKEK